VPASVSVSCDHIPYKSDLGIACMITCTFMTLCSLLLAGYLGVYSDHDIVRKAQPQQLIFLCFGIIILNISMIIRLGENTKVACFTRMWASHIGFDMIIAPIWSRLYRIHIIFEAALDLKVIHVTNADTMFKTLGLVAIDIILLIISTVFGPHEGKVEPLEITVNTNHTSAGGEDLKTPWSYFIDMQECNSEFGVLSTIPIFYKAGLVMSAVYFVWKTREVETAIVDHGKITLFIYLIALKSAVVILLNILVVGEDAEVAQTINLIGALLVSATALILLIFPVVEMRSLSLSRVTSSFGLS